MNRDRASRLRIIRIASEPGAWGESSLADGLRAVLAFEELNRTRANPTNPSHRRALIGMGSRFALYRAFRCAGWERRGVDAGKWPEA